MLNYIFTAAFAVEALIKIGALYPRRYFSSGWNVFDFIIVVTSILGAILQSGTGSSAFRRSAHLQSFPYGEKVEIIEHVVPDAGDDDSCARPTSLCLLALLFFIYAILGTQVFGRLAYGEALNRHANFKTFGNSLSTLLRTLTGEGWQEIMYDWHEQEKLRPFFRLRHRDVLRAPPPPRFTLSALSLSLRSLFSTYSSLSCSITIR